MTVSGVRVENGLEAIEVYLLKIYLLVRMCNSDDARVFERK